MSLTTQNIRDKVRKNLGSLDSSDSGADDTSIDLLINQAWWEICDKFHFREREAFSTFPTIAGQSSYNVPGDFLSIQNIAIQDNNSYQWTPLDRMTIDEYDQVNEPNPDTTTYDAPLRYFRRSNLIYLSPTPDQVYQLQLWYVDILPNLTSGVSPSIPQSWHEIILYGATWRGALEITSDQEKFQIYSGLYYAQLASAEPIEAKEEGDTHRGGASVIKRRYR